MRLLVNVPARCPMTCGVAWTGSHDNGTKRIHHFGSGLINNVGYGAIIRPGERGHGGQSRREQERRLYAISPALTVAR